MERMPLEENAASRERLRVVLTRLTAEDLGRAMPSGATVALCLTELAFWDRWAAHLIGRWRSGQLPPPRMPHWYDEAINETLVPMWRVVPVEEVHRLVLEAADAVDHAIERVETPVAAAIIAAGEAHLLCRHDARTRMLDVVEETVPR